MLASKAFLNILVNLINQLREQFYKYAGKKTVEVIDLLSAKYKIENKEKFTNEIFDIVAKSIPSLKLVDGVKDFIVKSKKSFHWV